MGRGSVLSMFTRLRRYLRPRYLRPLLVAIAFIPLDAVSASTALRRERRTGRRPYILWGCGYVHYSAGTVACHRLVHELNNAGYDAFSTGAVNPNWNERRINKSAVFLLLKFGNPIVIYPEVVIGNPLHAQHVARWILNVPGHLGGDTTFDGSELIFTWCKDFYPTDRILSWDIVERDLFNDKILPDKEMDCFYVGKGPFRGANPTAFTDGMVEITRTWPSERHELADLLRRTRVLYTYDDLTMLTFEALLCGCKVVLLPEQRELLIDDPIWDFVKQDHEAQFMRFILETQRYQASHDNR